MTMKGKERTMLRIVLALMLLPLPALANTMTVDLGELPLTSITTTGNHRYDVAFDDLNGMAVAGQPLSLSLRFSTAAVHAPYEYYLLSVWLYTDGAAGTIQGTGRLSNSKDLALVSNSADGILATTLAVNPPDFTSLSDVSGAVLDMTLPNSVGRHVTGATLTIRERAISAAEPSSGSLLLVSLIALSCIYTIRR